MRISTKAILPSLFAMALISPANAQSCIDLLRTNFKLIESARSVEELSINGGSFERCVSGGDADVRLCGGTRLSNGIELVYVRDKSGNDFVVDNRKIRYSNYTCKPSPSNGPNVYAEKSGSEWEGTAAGVPVKYRVNRVSYYQKIFANF